MPKKTTRLAFINADWRNFQNKPAAEESGKEAIMINDYLRILNRTGWQHTHIIQATHVRATLQRNSRLCNAEEKDTWSDKQICDCPETTRMEIIQPDETKT